MRATGVREDAGPGTSLGMGFGAVTIQNVAPLVAISSALLYWRCTFQVFGPTVRLAASLLQISPFSAPEVASNQALSCGSENGDICNGEAANLTVGPNTWNVQRQ